MMVNSNVYHQKKKKILKIAQLEKSNQEINVLLVWVQSKTKKISILVNYVQAHNQINVLFVKKDFIMMVKNVKDVVLDVYIVGMIKFVMFVNQVISGFQ